jgi:hypothetical protein
MITLDPYWKNWDSRYSFDRWPSAQANPLSSLKRETPWLSDYRAILFPILYAFTFLSAVL